MSEEQGRREQVTWEYSQENLESFARAYALHHDVSKAFGDVFHVRRMGVREEQGNILLGRQDVKAMIAAEQEKNLSAAMAATHKSELEKLDEAIEIVRKLMMHAESEPTKLKACEKYIELENLRKSKASQEDIPEELRAFLEELRIAECGMRN